MLIFIAKVPIASMGDTGWGRSVNFRRALKRKLQSDTLENIRN